MLRHTLLLLFLYGVRTSTGRPQNEVTEARGEIKRDGIRKSEVGANGSGAGSGGGVLRNFRNPVLEYLLSKDYPGKEDANRKGIIREIRHGQTIFLPQGNFGASPGEDADRTPVRDSVANLYELVNGHGVGTLEKFVSSPVLHLNRSQTAGEWTRTETFPAAAVVVNTDNADGTLKSSVTHFRPSVTLGAAATSILYAPYVQQMAPAPNLPLLSHSAMTGPSMDKPQRITWPFAGFFPIVINDPFLAAYNGITSSMYNTFSSMVEYGPDADICRGKDEQKDDVKTSRKDGDGSEFAEVTLDAEVKLIRTTTEKAGGGNSGPGTEERRETAEGGEVGAERKRRKVRDTTGIMMNFKNGARVKVEVEEPNPRSLLKRPGHGDLVLRKGGIAIAGPGGAATAYTGGTAIVGPYGTVYKSPQGTAIVGPNSRVINITDDMSFEDILKLHQSQKNGGNGAAAPERRAAAGRKFKNYKNYFSYLTDLPISIESAGHIRREEEGQVVTLPVADLIGKMEDITREEFTEIAEDLARDERVADANGTLLVFRPKARAEAGRRGVAVSAPLSHAILFPNRRADIKFEPQSVASAGPGGFAHAHSDLLLSYFRRR